MSLKEEHGAKKQISVLTIHIPMTIVKEKAIKNAKKHKTSKNSKHNENDKNGEKNKYSKI